MHLSLACNREVSVEHQPIEVVERKGVGHPDTLCDRVAEELSIALSRYYLDHFSAILHHNTDKALLVGGRARVAFGGGEIIEPMYLLLAGRATVIADECPVPVGEMAIQQTAEWLRLALPHLRLPGHLVIDSRIKPSSPELVALYRHPGIPRANDTAVAVAYAPLSALERIVKESEQRLNSDEIHRRMPQLGQDIKVMGIRQDEHIDVTVSAAFVAANTPDMAAYLAGKDAVAAIMRETAASVTRRAVEVQVNAADRVEDGSIFLTVTGTSAEQGDDGQVGRGNRGNGLITPMRPMVLEAIAGKNPVSHVGKLYAVYAQRIADRLCADLPEVRAAVVMLLSRIGDLINAPREVAVRVESDAAEALLRTPVQRIVQDVLDEWTMIRDGFLTRRWSLF